MRLVTSFSIAMFSLALPLICLLLIGCDKSATNSSTSDNSVQINEIEIPANYPLTVTDELQREVKIVTPPQRIVSLSPSNTETLFVLGLEDRIVGVTHLCDYPPAALEKEKVGDFNANSISMERIISMKPDLVISGGGFHQDVISNLTRLNVTVLAVEPKQFDQIYARIELLGKVCDVEPKATELVESLKKRVAVVRKRSIEIKPDPPIKVFYQIWNDPISTTGNVSFIGEMLQTVQVNNVFSDLNTGYAPITEEALLVKNPELFLIPMYHGGEEDVEQILSRPAWQGIDAIKNKRIAFLPDDEVSRHGPRFVEGLEAIFHACYPEATLD
ncbi:Vitamin B12-binding protein precursor [Polystyrenella longa]|uniref:Vitamin B12-binding protein n=1 Tax=Polystyrenella longa TaxID=2528007 RepID=A0A518CQG5_9PLAN|nr:cobalamin-binding protein [Polystyrenella longa]QDU81461.1 Vitamin B12-binding protein precursor [Polystyrenella longa]